MTETTGTPALNEALAKFQAALPRVGKDNTAKVKSDKANYTYKYADLADVSQAVEPALGRVGLAFTALPTMQDGAFVLAYKLTHCSGEELAGAYPLPDPLRLGPQVIGSAITYARRYCLCAVAGIHPDGEDDDAARAQSTPFSAGDAWESAVPAQRPQRPANGNGHVSRPVQEPAIQADGEPDPDAQQYADEAVEALTLTSLQEIQKQAREAGKLTAIIVNPATQGKGRLAEFIDYHRKRIKEMDDALAGLNDVAAKKRIPLSEVETQFKLSAGKSIEDATPAELRKFHDEALAEVAA